MITPRPPLRAILTAWWLSVIGDEALERAIIRRGQSYSEWAEAAHAAAVMARTAPPATQDQWNDVAARYRARCAQERAELNRLRAEHKRRWDPPFAEFMPQLEALAADAPTDAAPPGA